MLQPPIPRVPASGRHVRHGWTIIELSIVAGVAAILVAVALPNLDFSRWRMDGAMRVVQNQLMWAQSQAVQRNMNVMVTFYTTQDQFRIVEDSNANGTIDSGERTYWRTLSAPAHFLTPGTTIDGAAPGYATGPGLTYYASSYAQPTVTFYPNGSASGDIVVYVGTTVQQKEYTRAIQVTAATSKMYFWRMQSDGVWKRSNL